MTFDPNDPRLTAYVLGELEPADRAEVEALLNDSHECRQAVEEIRSTVGWLTERLHEEQAAHSVTPETNHRPIAVGYPPRPATPARPVWPRRVTVALLASFAALLLLAGTITLILERLPQDQAPGAASLEQLTLVDGSVASAAKKAAPRLILKSVKSRSLATGGVAFENYTYYAPPAPQTASTARGANRASGGVALLSDGIQPLRRVNRARGKATLDGRLGGMGGGMMGGTAGRPQQSGEKGGASRRFQRKSRVCRKMSPGERWIPRLWPGRSKS